MGDHSKVWVVDDDEDDQYLIRFAFSELVPSVKVKSLYNGDQVLPYLEKAETLPQLILLDLNMPGTNGFDVLRQIRAIPTYRQIPVVVLTTSSSSIDKQKAIELGATAFLSKPPLFNKLSALVQQLAIEWEVAY